MKKILTLLVLLFTSSLNAASVNLAWDPSVTPGVNYRVYSSASLTAPFSLVLTTASTSATLTFTGTTRFYTTAFNSDGESVASNVLTVVAPATPPAPPTNLRSTAISASRIDLQWDPADFDILVERNQSIVALVGPTQSFYLDTTGLRKNKVYSYRIRGADTGYSNITTARTYRH